MPNTAVTSVVRSAAGSFSYQRTNQSVNQAIQPYTAITMMRGKMRSESITSAISSHVCFPIYAADSTAVLMTLESQPLPSILKFAICV
jgi:hypothetical protein